MSRCLPPDHPSPAACASTAGMAVAALLIGGFLAGCAAEKSMSSPPAWAAVEVQLPVSNASFPAGQGSDIANAQCLICHSAGMVLHQPPLTLNEWVGEINKMRTVYGAPMPAGQIDALAKYLFSLAPGDGRSD